MKIICKLGDTVGLFFASNKMIFSLPTMYRIDVEILPITQDKISIAKLEKIELHDEF